MRIRDIVVTAMAAVLLALPYLLIHHKPSTDQIMSAVSDRLEVLPPSSGGLELVSNRDPEIDDEVNVKEEDVETSSDNVLEAMLARAAMPDKTVIITTLNQAWAANNTMIDVFLESFHRGENIKRLLNHLVIVALDQTSFDRCRQLHSHCFMLQTEGVDFAGNKPFMSEDFLKMMWQRMRFLTKTLELGYNFVFTDADIVWFRNPFEHFAKNVDFQVSCDRNRGNLLSLLNKPNCGYQFTRSNKRTIAMYNHWCAGGNKNPDIDEQTQLTVMLRRKELTKCGVKIRFLETDKFSGFCQRSKDMSKVVTMHANCCTGMDNKIQDLRRALDSWKDNKSVPSFKTEKEAKRADLWRVPLACRRSVWPPPAINGTSL